jgi:hypothetical protein
MSSVCCLEVPLGVTTAPAEHCPATLDTTSLGCLEP